MSNEKVFVCIYMDVILFKKVQKADSDMKRLLTVWKEFRRIKLFVRVIFVKGLTSDELF